MFSCSLVALLLLSVLPVQGKWEHWVVKIFNKMSTPVEARLTEVWCWFVGNKKHRDYFAIGGNKTVNVHSTAYRKDRLQCTKRNDHVAGLTFRDPENTWRCQFVLHSVQSKPYECNINPSPKNKRICLEMFQVMKAYCDDKDWKEQKGVQVYMQINPPKSK